ncbi:6-bladed beta-propeller, partial [Parabacteroides sp. OttesenSCG-928-G21]|nr:6-bladed beta-propeller [Parabacteroides sp. OttesenSCG-928-G21]
MQISRWNYQILLLTCLLLLSCGQSKVDKTGDIPVIDIIGSLGEYEAIPVSQYITELEYIPLETRDDCLIGGWIGSIVTSTHIFVLNNKFCYAFGRDGRFLGQIGSAGQGPGEYSSLNDFTVDEKKRSLYLETSRTLLEYSWDNTFRQSINLPQNKYETPLNNIIFVRDNLFLGHSRNYKGDLNHNFILFDESSEIVKSFDNYMQFNRARLVGGQDDGSMKPYRKGEYVHVK